MIHGLIEVFFLILYEIYSSILPSSGSHDKIFQLPYKLNRGNAMAGGQFTTNYYVMHFQVNRFSH